MRGLACFVSQCWLINQLYVKSLSSPFPLWWNYSHLTVLIPFKPVLSPSWCVTHLLASHDSLSLTNQQSFHDYQNRLEYVDLPSHMYLQVLLLFLSFLLGDCHCWQHYLSLSLPCLEWISCSMPFMQCWGQMICTVCLVTVSTWCVWLGAQLHHFQTIHEIIRLRTLLGHQTITYYYAPQSFCWFFPNCLGINWHLILTLLLTIIF